MKIENANELKDLFERQGKTRWTVAATGAEERVDRLRRLRAAILDRQDELYEALWKDFRKSRFEAWLTEVYPSISELDFASARLKSWMKDRRAKRTFIVPFSGSRVRYEPMGRVLIMAPWNYPFQLFVAPLVSAIAAGNCVVAKPSNKTPNTSRFIASLIESLFPPEEVAVVEGPGAVLGEELLKLPFDYFFFTGSPAVGARVGEAAQRAHAGLTLELGGKSPAILLRNANIREAAKKLMWGKCVNAGQTCIAPDYLFCPRDSLEDFVAEARRAVEKFYGPDEASWRKSADFPRIVDSAACARHRGLIEDAAGRGARVEFGGSCDVEERYVSPTLLSGVDASMSVMADEIFGPILPVLAYDSLDEAIEFVRGRPKPLALYVFGRDKDEQEKVLAGTTSGSACVNNLLVQIENLNVPFGGVGMSGTGNYHGFYGFKAFSHERNIMNDLQAGYLGSIYPPYGTAVQGRLEGLLKKLFRM